MDQLRFYLFGKMEVRGGKSDLVVFASRRVEELLCYLLLNRDNPQPREALADLLWSDVTTTQSKNYLRKALWQLQSSLDAHLASRDERILLADTDWIQVNPRCSLWLDVAILEKAFASVQGLLGRKLDANQALALDQAIALYRGNLLEGWYQEWCLYERERLQHIYLASLDKLMDYCEAHNFPEKGLMYGQSILRYDRARERTHQRLMRLYCLAGERTEALRQYEKCVTALREELGVEPSRRTCQLLAKVQSDDPEVQPLERNSRLFKNSITMTCWRLLSAI
jgi:DNA-binding SARP family transcriptional activator